MIWVADAKLGCDVDRSSGRRACGRLGSHKARPWRRWSRGVLTGPPHSGVCHRHRLGGLVGRTTPARARTRSRWRPCRSINRVARPWKSVGALCHPEGLRLELVLSPRWRAESPVPVLPWGPRRSPHASHAAAQVRHGRPGPVVLFRSISCLKTPRRSPASLEWSRSYRVHPLQEVRCRFRAGPRIHGLSVVRIWLCEPSIPARSSRLAWRRVGRDTWREIIV